MLVKLLVESNLLCLRRDTLSYVHLHQETPSHFRDYRKNDDRWTTGTVVEQTGPVSYRVEVAPGFTWRRHTDQIRSTAVPHNPVVMPSVNFPNAMPQAQERSAAPPIRYSMDNTAVTVTDVTESVPHQSNDTTAPSDVTVIPEKRFSHLG